MQDTLSSLPNINPRIADCQSVMPQSALSASDTDTALRLIVGWARDQAEVREAQHLRWRVFGQEIGAQLKTASLELDEDVFDDYCEHLIVRDRASNEVVGTYRLLTPTQAKRAGSYYSETEFDLTRLRAIRHDMVELGRSCVHPSYRDGSVILALWSALAQFMATNQLRWMIGCATVPMSGRTSAPGHEAASIWRKAFDMRPGPVEHRVRPRLPLPIASLKQDMSVDLPPLIKGYLRLGANVIGEPAWDPAFNAADLPMLLNLDQIPSRYRKHLLGGLV
jgi:putative hemolysin